MQTVGKFVRAHPLCRCVSLSTTTVTDVAESAHSITINRSNGSYHGRHQLLQCAAHSAHRGLTLQLINKRHALRCVTNARERHLRAAHESRTPRGPGQAPKRQLRPREAPCCACHRRGTPSSAAQPPCTHTCGRHCAQQQPASTRSRARTGRSLSPPTAPPASGHSCRLP